MQNYELIVTAHKLPSTCPASPHRNLKAVLGIETPQWVLNSATQYLFKAVGSSTENEDCCE